MRTLGPFRKLAEQSYRAHVRPDVYAAATPLQIEQWLDGVARELATHNDFAEQCRLRWDGAIAELRKCDPGCKVCGRDL